MKIGKLFLVKLLLFVSGMFFYILAVVSTFVFDFYVSDANPLVIFIVTSLGGLGALALGYASVVILGGGISLKLNEFIARVTMCKQVVEVNSEEPQTSARRAWRDFLLYMPALVFALALILAWDVHSLHDPQTAIFYPVLRALDIFSKPIAADRILRPIEVVLAMTVLIGVAGFAPSMAVPYFRKFKITGVNSGPFHTNFVYLVVGLIVGLGTVLTLLGFIYNVLWVGKGPLIYHYVFLALLGLSLHYALGVFLGRDRSEDMVMARLRRGSRKRVVHGSVVIQGPPSSDETRPS